MRTVEVRMKKKIIILSSVALAAALLVGCLAYVFGVVLPEKRDREELEAAVKAYRTAKITLYTEKNAEYDDYEVDVAFLGDSLTDGYDLARYYPDLLVENRGIGGETTHGLLARLEVSVLDLKPKVAVMLIGANNLDTMFEDYETIVKRLCEELPETKIVLLSLTSMGLDWGHKNHLAAFNNVKIKAIAAKYACTVVDLYTPLLNLETDEIHAEYTTDGGHLTHEGYVVFTETVRPVLDKLLSES